MAGVGLGGMDRGREIGNNGRFTGEVGGPLSGVRVLIGGSESPRDGLGGVDGSGVLFGIFPSRKASASLGGGVEARL